MVTKHNPRLTSAEVAVLWTQYQNDTAAICINKHMMEYIEDQDIKDVFDFSMSLISKQLQKIKEFFMDEGYPVPIGFTDQDIESNKPRLFSDVFCLHYINIMSIHGCEGYSSAITNSSRSDVLEYYTQCLNSAVELCKQTKKLLQEKGLYFRPPVITPPEKTDFVDDKRFLAAGWFSEKRPLSCIEISTLYFNLKKSILAKSITVAFSQVSPTKNVKDVLIKATEVKDKHISMFNEILNTGSLPPPPTFEEGISNSTNSPFSDKLMIFHVAFLFSTAMTYYGTGWASSPRKDLAPKFALAIADDLRIGGILVDLMIKNAWLEEPPLSSDRSKLIKQ
ncbi:hypothetical protein JOC85_001045 [Bacillus mesophilus]|uniref:DUF3231 family protein n=1 Tax=Bacillus mesophilus TaxID=1808955 RepID=A0A6M0Q433_9BACI|nr:DUF3231 family protein [Bacillus mesophilus]MBM7660278.1 hypothetical protein [Bacillus mesophilus]NEY70992.1 DUF3231 family protein [Bacillus mesophilus]